LQRESEGKRVYLSIAISLRGDRVGWIKLHRELMVSATFQKLTAVQKLIAIYILLNANHKDGLWFDFYKGAEVPIKRGQLITSRKKIVEEWFQKDRSVTEQKVRTALLKLSKLGFITIESTNWYTLITVVNYEVYQGDASKANQLVNQDLTNTQPALNQGLTINKNEKNVKKAKKAKEYKPASMLSGTVSHSGTTTTLGYTKKSQQFRTRYEQNNEFLKDGWEE
jgi:hypothetical protein